MKIGDLVLVEWEDSYGCSPRWEDITDEVHLELMICKSIGWLIRKTAQSILLVPHLAENEYLGVRQGCGDITIPQKAIIGFAVLHTPKRRQKLRSGALNARKGHPR